MPTVFEKPEFSATMMAAVPYRDMEWTARLIMRYFPECPCLPVMTRSIRWILEGIPCLVIDREKRSVFLDITPEREGELLEFYEKYDQKDLDYFATTHQTAPFFYEMIKTLKENRPSVLKWVIFHSPGPLLLGEVLKRLNGSPAGYHETLRDVLVKAINMKAKWLERKIKEEIPEVEVIADLHETTLVKFTSAGGTGTREQIINTINNGFDGLGCLTWIHCCSNIDWSLLTASNVDVINFDAYQHSEKIALYAKEFNLFLENGGMIGWGIVPVIEDLIQKESIQTLVERLQRGIDFFVSKGVDEKLLASSSWILPSCETVLLTDEQSDLVFTMTNQISKIMKNKYGFKSRLLK